ncbi:AI-2E family transporter [Wenzhouxiangella limi]|uniref:AI-2E family transporter n=1 Tax=Wenzhouxiangella limi TaxID=2707351 RepID=A0A845V6E1_9GAMM|nr:AI-2E family transporter [Wenzhouxiangella limi]NDY96736.1 AI-2E family transporter [Wenzhouxiangella limi]
MLSRLNDWFQRNFSDPQVVILALFLVLGLVLVLIFGRILTPVFASLIIAYLLEGAVQRLERFGLPRLISVISVFSGFMTALFFLLFGLLPMVTRQLTAIVAELPRYIRIAQDWLETLPDRYPQIVSSPSDTAVIEPDSPMGEEGENLALISQEQLSQMLDNLGVELGRYGTQLVSFSGVVGVASLLVFLVIMPVLVFFFLKDKARLIAWFARYLPRDRGLVSTVWKEVDVQIANYVRGKALEILIVWIVTYVVFSLLNMPFTMLLSMVVGFSVIIPYIGAAVVTIPVALVALIAFGGLTAAFWSVIIAYAIIQALDGNVLVPILFSEVVDLHPVAIITAILVFGGLWGFWGVFFAIPLATLVNAVLRAWPRVRSDADHGAASAAMD